MSDPLVLVLARRAYAGSKAFARLWRAGGPLLPPIFKGTLFGLSLLYVQISSFAILPILLCVAVGSICYMQPVTRSFTFGTSFFLVASLGLLLTSRFVITLPVALHAGIIGQIVFAAAFGVLFFILLGIKNQVLVRRRQWYSVLYIALIYGISLLFFTSVTGEGALRHTLLLGIFSYLLLSEYFGVQAHPKSRALTLISLVHTLLAIQVAWAVSLLPIGFSKSASVLTLVLMMASSVTDRYLRGSLTALFLRRSVGLALLLIAVLLFSARLVI